MAEIDSTMPISSGKLLSLMELCSKDRYVTIKIINIVNWNCIFHDETSRFSRCVSHFGSPYQLQIQFASGFGCATVSKYKGCVLIIQTYHYYFMQMTCRM